MLKLPAKLYLDHPCSSSFLGTVQCCAPALKPRAVYGKAIRVIVPLKRRTDRNTTAWTRCRVSLFYRLPFFFFSSSKNSCKTPYYSLLFQFISHLSPCPNSPTLLVSHSFHLTLNCLLVFSPFLSQHLSTLTPILKGFPSKRSVETAMSCNLSHFFRYHLGNKNHLTASLWNTCTVSLVPLCTRVENRSGIATDIS